MEIENKELAFKNSNLMQTASVEVFGQVISMDKKLDGTFEDRIVFSANTVDSKAIVPTAKQPYIKGIMLSAGQYKIKLVLRDLLTGKHN